MESEQPDAADEPDSFDLADACAQLTAGFPLVNSHPDVAGVLRDPRLLALIGPALAAPFRTQAIDAVVAAEARGPILGALVARELGAGLVLARKRGQNHPGADVTLESAPTWRGEAQSFQARSFDLEPGQRILLVDDWITTGNTLRAARTLIERSGAVSVGAAALVNKADPATLDDLAAHTLVDFDDLVP